MKKRIKNNSKDKHGWPMDKKKRSLCVKCDEPILAKELGSITPEGMVHQQCMPILMPFGKHKGEDIEKVPDDYLLWFYKNVDREDQHQRVWDYLDDNIDAIKKNVTDNQYEMDMGDHGDWGDRD